MGEREIWTQIWFQYSISITLCDCPAMILITKEHPKNAVPGMKKPVHSHSLVCDMPWLFLKAQILYLSPGHTPLLLSAWKLKVRRKISHHTREHRARMRSPEGWDPRGAHTRVLTVSRCSKEDTESVEGAVSGFTWTTSLILLPTRGTTHSSGKYLLNTYHVPKAWCWAIGI